MQAGLLKEGDLVVTNDDKPRKRVYIVGEIRMCTKQEQVLLLQQMSPTEVRKHCWFPTDMLGRPENKHLDLHDYKMKNPDDKPLQGSP